jgi:hypothetical protein
VSCTPSVRWPGFDRLSEQQRDQAQDDLDDYVRRGLLPSLKLGRHRRFVRTDVVRAIDERRRRGC